MNWFLRVWKRFWQPIERWWIGGILASELEKPSLTRTEAELAVERIVMTTNIQPDCVSATVIRGGTAIIITHDRAKEAFIGNGYEHAADKAIEWLTQREGRFILQAKSTGLSRKSQKVFNAKRRDAKKARRKRH